jgi:hypothetical protein
MTDFLIIFRKNGYIIKYYFFKEMKRNFIFDAKSKQKSY